MARVEEMAQAGRIILVIGFLAIGGSFLMDTTVGGLYGDRTHNLGLLQMQMMVLQSGGAAAVVGAVLLAVGRLLEQLKTAGLIEPVETTRKNVEPSAVTSDRVDVLARPGGMEAARARLRGNEPDDGARV